MRSAGVENGQSSAALITVIADELTVPWDIAFLPGGDMLVTERPGTLLRFGKEKTITKIDGVQHVGEGGLLGIALHPNFAENNFVYLYLTTKVDSRLMNRVERYTLTDNMLANHRVIIDGIPGASYHDGGMIAFGPDNFLYVTTGDAGNSDNAQNRESLAGKILRMHDDGAVPEDNPFGNTVWSYGHRNVQGIAWDALGRMWATEHGPSGASTGYDELNLIVKGGNYGWPIYKGDVLLRKGADVGAMRAPVVHSGADETWAPGGIASNDGKLFFTGLRGESLYEAIPSADGSSVQLKAHFRSDFGRLRAVVTGFDGMLYVSTSNTDGRGTQNDGDDKIIKFNPQLFK